MTAKTWMLLAMLTAVPALSGCTAALGAGGAIAADEAVEQETGEGLF
jgi:hypothetical protein